MLKRVEAHAGYKFKNKIRYFCSLLLFLSSVLIAAETHMEQSQQPKPGTAKASNVVIPFLLNLGCAKRMGYPRDFTMRQAVWAILKKIQENEIDPREFRESLVKLYEQDVYVHRMIGPDTGYLPELQKTDRDYTDPVQIKELENPILDSWDYILALVDKKYGSDDRSLYNLTLWADRIDKVADNMQDWLIKSAISPSSDALLESHCKNLQRHPWDGEAYANHVRDLRKVIRTPDLSPSFIQRNPEAAPSRPYVNADISYPLNAEQMAEVFMRGIWCENTSDLFHDLAYRLQEQQFLLNDFLNAIESRAKQRDAYATRSTDNFGKASADRVSYSENGASLMDILAPLSKIYLYAGDIRLSSQERFYRSVDNAALLHNLDQRLQRWQRENLLGLNKNDKYERRACVEQAPRMLGQEFRTYLYHALKAKKEAKSVDLAKAPVTSLSHSDLTPLSHMEELKYPPRGSAYASSVALQFLRVLSCSKILGYRNDVSVHAFIWEVMEDIQSGKLNPDELKLQIEEQYNFEKSLNYPAPGSTPRRPKTIKYLPELYKTSQRAKTTDELAEIVEGENPILPAWDYILELSKNPQRFQREISYAAVLIDVWARQNGIQRPELSEEQCTRSFVKKPLRGHEYRAQLKNEHQEERYPEVTEDYKGRNPEPKIRTPYKAPENFGQISAQEMARKWANALWCENINELYWELTLRLNRGQFSAEEFRKELNVAIEAKKYSADYKGVDIKGLLDALGDIEHFSEKRESAGERWMSYSTGLSHLLGPETMLLNWQKSHILNEQAKERRCLERPNSQVGQELRNYLKSSYVDFRRELVEGHELAATLTEQKLKGENEQKILDLDRALAFNKEAEKKTRDDYDRNFRQLNTAYDLKNKELYDKLLSDLVVEKEQKLEAHNKQMFDLIELSGKDYGALYGGEGFAGACSTSAGNTWRNGPVIATMYRHFAEEYSSDLRARYAFYQGERAKLISQGKAPQVVDKMVSDSLEKYKKDRRASILKEFKTLFYVACAESDFTPFSSMAFKPYETDPEKYHYEKVSDYSLAGLLLFKQKLLDRASEGTSTTSVIHSQGNHGPFQSSIDRFYIGEKTEGFIENEFIAKVIVNDKVMINGKETLVPNLEKSLPLINRFCETEHSFPRADARGVNIEIFNALVKNDSNDKFELMSVRKINAYKNRDQIAPEAIAAYGVLHGACLPFSIHLHQMTMADFKGGSYYETLMAKETKRSCSDGNGKSLCSEPLSVLASRVEALAFPVAETTAVYDNPALATKQLPLGQTYTRQLQQNETERGSSVEAILRLRNQALQNLSIGLDGIQKTREQVNDEYRRRLRENIEFRDRKVKEAQREGLGI